MNERILVAEDDSAILVAVADLLRIEGYRVEEASDGLSALERFRDSRPDLVLLDVMMPGMSGYDVCREIRREDPATPVLMLTAKGAEVDRVVGLELGADDYIVKPFGVSELVARVRAALRRSAISGAAAGEKLPALQIGELSVDFEGMTGCLGGRRFSLTPKETALLRRLVLDEGRVLSRETLLETVWGIDPDCDVSTRSVDQHIARLRQKIERDPANPRIIKTAHGAGYRFVGGR
ncbi:MAG: response regulator transcription factor [Synergistaceae bacterium]|jgi:DNA-binding response OmpR family regulator|nr:response regulator transcription factor [Synergistaceae bacterium]